MTMQSNFPTMHDENVLKPVSAAETGDIQHSILVPSNAVSNQFHFCKLCLQGKFLCSEKTQTLLDLLTDSQDEIITVKIPDLLEVKLFSTNNQYIDVSQGTPEWRAPRAGVITASKLPSLLGFCGNNEFDSSWFCIHNKVDESICRPKKFKNF